MPIPNFLKLHKEKEREKEEQTYSRRPAAFRRKYVKSQPVTPTDISTPFHPNTGQYPLGKAKSIKEGLQNDNQLYQTPIISRPKSVSEILDYTGYPQTHHRMVQKPDNNDTVNKSYSAPKANDRFVENTAALLFPSTNTKAADAQLKLVQIPKLAMPKPKHALAPTRAILRGEQNDKTLIESDAGSSTSIMEQQEEEVLPGVSSELKGIAEASGNASPADRTANSGSAHTPLAATKLSTKPIPISTQNIALVKTPTTGGVPMSSSASSGDMPRSYFSAKSSSSPVDDELDPLESKAEQAQELTPSTKPRKPTPKESRFRHPEFWNVRLSISPPAPPTRQPALAPDAVNQDQRPSIDYSIASTRDSDIMDHLGPILATKETFQTVKGTAIQMKAKDKQAPIGQEELDKVTALVPADLNQPHQELKPDRTSALTVLGGIHEGEQVFSISPMAMSNTGEEDEEPIMVSAQLKGLGRFGAVPKSTSSIEEEDNEPISTHLAKVKSGKGVQMGTSSSSVSNNSQPRTMRSPSTDTTPTLQYMKDSAQSQAPTADKPMNTTKQGEGSRIQQTIRLPESDDVAIPRLKPQPVMSHSNPVTSISSTAPESTSDNTSDTQSELVVLRRQIADMVLEREEWRRREMEHREREQRILEQLGRNQEQLSWVLAERFNGIPLTPGPGPRARPRSRSRPREHGDGRFTPRSTWDMPEDYMRPYPYDWEEDMISPMEQHHYRRSMPTTFYPPVDYPPFMHDPYMAPPPMGMHPYGDMPMMPIYDDRPRRGRRRKTSLDRRSQQDGHPSRSRSRSRARTDISDTEDAYRDRLYDEGYESRLDFRMEPRSRSSSFSYHHHPNVEYER
ncbi:hypothetical protein BZG36_02035 [Bifiguratus adelaidae]|uniref:Uncharacterized protein n=1 Tax=Bifiguratus adelaidae TaxID=1938954 RepID=A0A261Y1Z4_9FUNG|nr:hypothetical protein BZG36_02035 [Bifiguratus adelaidae]